MSKVGVFSCGPGMMTKSVTDGVEAVNRLVLTNQRPVFRSRDLSGPIRGQYTGHKTRLDQSNPYKRKFVCEQNVLKLVNIEII